MSCDFGELLSIDAGDPDQVNVLLQQCLEMALDPTLWLWAIGFTVVGALVGALIGRHKRAVTRDTLLGALLGPIGWIISLYLPAAKPKSACPVCRGAVESADAHCRHCGAKLAPTP